MEAPRTCYALAGTPPSYRDPAPQCRLALPTEGITFHPVHYLTRRPFAHRFHYQSHGRRGRCRVGRGARTESQVRSPLRPQVGSVAGRSLPRWAARRGWLLCFGPKAGASEVAAVGAATAGQLAGVRRRGRLGPSPGGSRSCGVRGSARGERPEGLQCMARAAEGRGGERKRRRRTVAANLPARSPGAREWSPRHDEPPGGNDEGPPATQNISPQPSGAGRALHEPPAPLAAARSRPQGRQPVRASPVRVRGPARVAAARLLADSRARCGLLALPPSRPGGRTRPEPRREGVCGSAWSPGASRCSWRLAQPRGQLGSQVRRRQESGSQWPSRRVSETGRPTS